MVPMGVGKKEMIGFTTVVDQLVPKAADAGSGIDNDDMTALGSYLQAGCIATVFIVLFPGYGYGTSSPPAPDVHRLPFERINSL